jgi:hypothetical protein
MYGVASPMYYLGDWSAGFLGGDPPEPHCDFLYVCCRNARRARVLAVRAWRRRNARYLDAPDNPFTGVTTERLDNLLREEIDP